jgi:hypothetical protein
VALLVLLFAGNILIGLFGLVTLLVVWFDGAVTFWKTVWLLAGLVGLTLLFPKIDVFVRFGIVVFS